MKDQKTQMQHGRATMKGMSVLVILNYQMDTAGVIREESLDQGIAQACEHFFGKLSRLLVAVGRLNPWRAAPCPGRWSRDV